MTRGPGRPSRIAAAAAVTVALAVAVAVAGCGESRKNASSTATGAGATTSPTGGAPNPARAAVYEEEFRLTPANPKFRRAGKVTFVVANRGSVEHALEVHGPHGDVRTKPIPAGSFAELKVDLSEPGTYEWYCPIDGHRARGMRGTIVSGFIKPKPPRERSGGSSGSGGGGGSYSPG